jgi:hypothetical protein
MIVVNIVLVAVLVTAMLMPVVVVAAARFASNIFG